MKLCFLFRHFKILPSLWPCYLRPTCLLLHISLSTHCSLAGATLSGSLRIHSPYLSIAYSRFFLSSLSSVLLLYVSDLMSSRSTIYCHVLGVTSLRLFARSSSPTISILLSVGYLLISYCILGNFFLILVGNLQLMYYTSDAFHP
jgi:hypothetical protein